MSTPSVGKGLDSALYIHTQRRAASLHSAFFLGVARAPVCYLSLGRELIRLSRALQHLIGEIENPDSKSIRADNGRSAAEGLAIALGGVDGTLVDIERTLISLHVDRHATERWIYFAIKTRFHGSDERLRGLQQRVGHHCWTFGVVMRTLTGFCRPPQRASYCLPRTDLWGHRNDSLKLVAAVQAMAVSENLRRAVFEQLRGFEQDVVTRRLENNCIHGRAHLFEDFPAYAIVRIIMFWAFKAISRLSHVLEAKQFCSIGYLNLLKSAWLLLKMQDMPSASPIISETRAVVALVSTVGSCFHPAYPLRSSLSHSRSYCSHSTLC